MTCFWDGLLSKITIGEINKALSPECQFITISREKFIMLLVENCTTTYNVTWNSSFIPEQEMRENMEWIRGYNIRQIIQGHQCSSCDPFLLLICQLFNVNIIHNYNGHIIKYVNIKEINRKKTLNFESDSGHFW